MALEIIKKINVDFYDKKYIMVNAKQFDSKSRLIEITCYDQGEPLTLSDVKQSAYVKYRKADGTNVFNACRINYRGQVLVELTEQMLATIGICYVDLLIVNKGDALVNVNNGEIMTIDGGSILSTMAFCVNVYETAVLNSEFESLDECDAINDLLIRAEADYAEVLMTAKSYAIGGTGMRAGEDTDNARYYYNQSRINANSSSNSEKMAKSYAVGGTGIRDGEDVDNAKYYASEVRNIVEWSNTGLIPMGSIKFSDLAKAAKITGYMYNITDDFVTDSTFVEGAGVEYNSGTNVYYTSDKKWDCLGGSATTRIETATVAEIKSYLGI